ASMRTMWTMRTMRTVRNMAANRGAKKMMTGPTAGARGGGAAHLQRDALAELRTMPNLRCAGRPQSRGSRFDCEDLVRGAPGSGPSPVRVGQDHLHVSRPGRTQAEVGVGRLTRRVAVARGDLAATQQCGGLAEPARGVDVDPRADAHAVDALRPIDFHPQPV